MAAATQAPALYLNTYGPLVMTRAGRQAALAYGLPPFVDGSIRREPDLEHPFPSISCLCRADRFAPRLRVGDVVAYLTTKGRYRRAERHWRLTAILRIAAQFDDHAAAAVAYRAAGLPLPSNCMVPGNPSKPVCHSHRHNEHRHLADDEAFRRRWDDDYLRWRAEPYPRFVACEPLYVNLSWDAPVVHDRDLRSVFGKVPGTRNPGALDLSKLAALTRRLGIAAPPSVPRRFPSAGRSRRNRAGPAPSGTPDAQSAPRRSACSPSRRTGPAPARPRGC